MESVNFEFLRSKWPELSGLGGFAEAYTHPDAPGAIAKLRVYCEQIVEWIHHDQRLPKPFQANLNDLLINQPFREVVPEVVLSKLHALRMAGNKSIHGNLGDTASAQRLLREAFDIGRWLHVTHAGGTVEDCPAFQEPPEGGLAQSTQRKEKREILEHVVAQEARMKELLSDLEDTRKKAKHAEASAEERRAALEVALKAKDQLQAVDPLSFNEAETRVYLIDQMLADQGWDVGKGATETDEVKKEYPVSHQPTESGEGFADYVLFDDNGKPLAVIEAKKTAEDPQKGRTQARHYADGLEKEHGQRPVIFYTNGFDLWIWNDAEGEPWRQLYGFYSRDSLQHLIYQRTARKPLSEITPSPQIAGRIYQIEAVRRIVEKFAEKKRKALVVQATGTGKTRVAVSLCDAMINAGWAKRVLFLCDRRELRRQANGAFKEFLSAEPRTIVSSASAGDTGHRIYLATYPAMMRVFESFDVGFFDLIIADESHRSLYNRYRQLFEYFDAHQVGLTATPVSYIARNTFKIFQCEDEDPTVHFSFQDAIESNPAYLVPFVVDTHTTEFLRAGIKYTQMSDEQRRQLEEDEELPEEIEFEQPQVDKIVYNKDTNRHILRNLMDNGIRVADGSRLGKTIIFARSMKHARLLEELFNEMYPQYGGNFCHAILSDDSRAESLIDDLKGNGTNPDLAIAISVDMLDTGVDIPELVNLVFAKPVYSYVKFWQMIGRGTRLCSNLFGPGQDKTHFQIFDHWANFERFEEGFQRAEPRRTRSLPEKVFLARLGLADAALESQQEEAFDLGVELLEQDIASLPAKSIPVREKWKQIHAIQQEGCLDEYSAATRATLEQEIAPLMQWIDITRQEEAWKFDRLIANAQVELIRGSSKFNDHRDEIVGLVSSLRINLSQVRVKLDLIEMVKSSNFRDQVTVSQLENVRKELRGIIQFRNRDTAVPVVARVIDVTEDESQIERGRHTVTLEKLSGLDMVAYRNRVDNVLQAIIKENRVLQMIRKGDEVSQSDVESLCSLVLTLEPGLDLASLIDYFPQAGNLAQAIRGIIGMEAKAVHGRFEAFVQAHPNLASHQIKFLDLLQNHIARFGSIEVAQLYEAPFTSIHSDGLDGLFEESLIEELLDVVGGFQAQGSKES
jgi:type I restriction enzyme R subunit